MFIKFTISWDIVKINYIKLEIRREQFLYIPGRQFRKGSFWILFQCLLFFRPGRKKISKDNNFTTWGKLDYIAR